MEDIYCIMYKYFSSGTLSWRCKPLRNHEIASSSFTYILTKVSYHLYLCLCQTFTSTNLLCGMENFLFKWTSSGKSWCMWLGTCIWVQWKSTTKCFQGSTNIISILRFPHCVKHTLLLQQSTLSTNIVQECLLASIPSSDSIYGFSSRSTEPVTLLLVFWK